MTGFWVELSPGQLEILKSVVIGTQREAIKREDAELGAELTAIRTELQIAGERDGGPSA